MLPIFLALASALVLLVDLDHFGCGAEGRLPFFVTFFSLVFRRPLLVRVVSDLHACLVLTFLFKPGTFLEPSAASSTAEPLFDFHVNALALAGLFLTKELFTKILFVFVVRKSCLHLPAYRVT